MSLTAQQLTLKSHIQTSFNKDVTDADVIRYFEYGLTTPEEFDIDGLANEAFELHYELIGLKPRWMNYWKWSVQDLETEIASLSKSLQAQLDSIEEEKLENKKAHQERIAANSYKPNLAFEGLKDLL